MNRPTLTIGGSKYRLTPTPKGENCCALCDLFNFCWDNVGGMPCLDFSDEKDWHFKKVADGGRKPDAGSTGV